MGLIEPQFVAVTPLILDLFKLDEAMQKRNVKKCKESAQHEANWE